MDNMIEAVAIGVGRGRGNATNVPERALIEQVKMRPLLYDKGQLEYRKPGVSDAAWSSVAEALNTSVSNCKKRWKSLRDTFIKYYRFEVLDNNSGSNRKRHKPWNFYHDLTFLKQHVELFRLEEAIKDDHETPDIERSYMVEDTKEVYEIKLAREEYEGEDELTYRMKDDEYEEVTEDEYGIIEQEEEALDKSPEKTFNEHFEAYEPETENEEQMEVLEEIPFESIPAPASRLPNELGAHQKQVPDDIPEVAISSPSKSIVDPDERYLMSCLPALKRFTPQQKAYLRMQMEKLLYEVEFGNVCEPKNKRFKI